MLACAHSRDLQAELVGALVDLQTEPLGRDLNLHVLTRKLFHSGLSGLLKPYAK